MQRRELLRRSGAGLTAALATGLAGCSGGGSDTSSGDDDESDSDETEEPSGGESIGSIAENSVEGLEIVDWTSDDSGDERYKATVTVRNTGDQETDSFDYNYELTLYDSDETDITGRVTGSSASGGTTITPGEEAEITILSGVDGSPTDVARYEIILNCDGFGADGVYCN